MVTHHQQGQTVDSCAVVAWATVLGLEDPQLYLLTEYNPASRSTFGSPTKITIEFLEFSLFIKIFAFIHS